MSNKRDYTFIIPKRSRIFISNVLDALFVFLLTLICYFIGAYPILNSIGQNSLVSEKNENAAEIVQILQDSHLALYDKSKNIISDVDTIYNIFVYQNIKYCYEEYPDIYKKELDEYGYESKKESLSTISSSSFENDYLAYFYTSYILNVKNKNGEKLVDYSSNTSKEYFINEVLDLDKTDGQNFYETTSSYDVYPRLKIDICRYLFQYNLMGVRYSTVIDTNNNFYNYFLKRYEEAGELLLKYDKYSEALSNYNVAYMQIENNELFSLLSCYFISIFLLFIVFPLFNENKTTLGMSLMKVCRVNIKNKTTKKIYFLNAINSILHNFFIILIAGLIIGGPNLLNYHFIFIGVFTINLLHFVLLSLIVNVISLLMFLGRKDKKGLFSLTTKCSYVQMIRKENLSENSEDETFDKILNS